MRWIKINDEWVSNPGTLSLWIHILFAADDNGTLQTSLSNLSSLSGLTIKQVRICLDRLIRAHEVAITTTNKHTCITVCKYDDYLCNEKMLGQAKGQAKGQTRLKSKEKSTKEESIYGDIKEESISKDILKKKGPDLSFVNEQLLPVFEQFLEMRKKIGKPLKTDTGIKARYNTLIRLSGNDVDLAIKIVNQSLEKEWQDFYSLKDNFNNPIQRPIGQTSTNVTDYRNYKP